MLLCTNNGHENKHKERLTVYGFQNARNYESTVCLSVSIKASLNTFMFHSVDIYLVEFEFGSILIQFGHQHDSKVVPKTDLPMI